MNAISVVRVGNHTLEVPSQHSPGDAGYDLRSTENKILIPDEQVLIHTGFCFAIPEGYVGIIKDRSGIASKYKLYTSAGVIDSSYRGEVLVCIRNCSGQPYKINIGDKIAQMIIIPYLNIIIEETHSLSNTFRNDKGFGSSGT